MRMVDAVTATKSLAIMAALFSAGSFGFASGTAARASSTVHYVAIPIDGLRSNDPSIAVAVNAHGDVAGEELVSQVPFLYRSGSTKLLEPPKGVDDASVMDLNNSDVIAVQARDDEGNALGFAI